MSETASANEETLNVGLFGGSFNPPHVAHALAVVFALATGGFDRVLVVPVFQHPFSKELASFEDRLEMCALGVGWIPGVVVSNVERDLGGESKTLRTIEHLRQTHPTWKLRLIVGSDVLADRAKWHRWDEIERVAPPWVIPRAGDPQLESRAVTSLPELSSTDVRESLKSGRFDIAATQLHHRVLQFISARKLYGAA
jgi:nicotinate-nucleotide adenylyltransferase